MNGYKLHGSTSSCVATLQQECSPVDYSGALRTALRILRNVEEHPGEGSYKQIKKTNKAFSQKVWKFNAGQQLMYSIGWMDLDDTIVLFDSHKVAAAVSLLEARLQSCGQGRASAGYSGKSTARSSLAKGSSAQRYGQGYQTGQSGGQGYQTGQSGKSSSATGGSNGWSGGSNAWSGSSNSRTGASNGYADCVCGQCGDDDDDSDSEDDSWECQCGQCGPDEGWDYVCGQCGGGYNQDRTSTYQTQKTKTTVTTKKPRAKKTTRATGSSYGSSSYGSSGYGGSSYGGSGYGGYGGSSYGGGSYGGGSYGGGSSCGPSSGG